MTIPPELGAFLDSGVVRGFGLCIVVALIFALVRYVLSVRTTIGVLQATLQHAQEHYRLRNEECYSLRSQLYAQTLKREQLEERLAIFMRPSPTAPLTEAVPGLLDAMKQIVQTKGCSVPPLTVGTVGDPKYVDLAAGIVIHDYRPLPDEDHEEGDVRPDPTELQGEGARYFAMPHSMSADEVAKRVRDFSTRRNAITATIHREALETAAAALDPGKRAALWAEGGDAAVYAYVAPVVQAALVELDAQTQLMTAAMLAPPVAWLSSPFDAALRDGLDRTQQSFDPPTAPTAE